MAPSKEGALRQRDLDRAVRAVAELFRTDEVVIIGSQALLLTADDTDRELRSSPEIDIYPRKIDKWQADHPEAEASEVIFTFLGEGSDFHRNAGFYVDGVDESTAFLASDWLDRSVRRVLPVGDGRTVTAIAPSAADIVAAKLMRGEPKDKRFASICYRQALTKQSDVLAILAKQHRALPPLLEMAKKLAVLASASKHSSSPSKGPPKRDPLEILLARGKGTER